MLVLEYLSVSFVWHWAISTFAQQIDLFRGNIKNWSYMSPLPIKIVEVLGMGSISIASVEALTRARHLIGIELKVLIRKKSLLSRC